MITKYIYKSYYRSARIRVKELQANGEDIEPSRADVFGNLDDYDLSSPLGVSIEHTAAVIAATNRCKKEWPPRYEHPVGIRPFDSNLIFSDQINPLVLIEIRAFDKDALR